MYRAREKNDRKHIYAEGLDWGEQNLQGAHSPKADDKKTVPLTHKICPISMLSEVQVCECEFTYISMYGRVCLT